MTIPERTMTRYLLGEMPEDERAEFERRYFEDPRLFEALARAESALVDDHARGRLDPPTLRRFEEFYLDDPARRARAAFAAALVAKVDEAAASPFPAAEHQPPGPARSRPGPGRPILFAALAAAAIVVAAGLVWYRSPSSRPGPEQVTSTPGGGPPPGASPAGPVPPVAAPTVTLALAIDPGVRGGGTTTPTPLVIPTGTGTVRLELGLRERDYPAYRVTLRPVGGGERLETPEITPSAEPGGPTLVLTLSADRLGAGDWILTLEGALGGGEFEDVSQTILRIDRPPTGQP